MHPYTKYNKPIEIGKIGKLYKPIEMSDITHDYCKHTKS